MNQPIEPDHINVPTEALESLRLRLTQVSHSLNTLQAQLHQPTLPPWSSLHNQFNVLLTQLVSLSSTITHQSDILQQTVTFPLPAFPTATEAGLMATLLRKKILPEVEEWCEEVKQKALGVKIRTVDQYGEWAAETVEEAKQEYEWYGLMTREEVDNGVKPPVYVAPEEEAGEGAKLTIEQILQFTCAGKMPTVA
ncbi:mediator of RNA polymerase II transcription subunit 8 [Yarrowia lipolytica]|jgi:mediator of RNA polymerase II transcription subunit 8|uniref:Mediator of RNA polymerase II transcription subunit 8 n=2 Tax=Yarrowia lipolytica TaxID=4952 RepID=MED8_YARLI|nr:YALI0B02068p [Yarrowia lipolytica CLIB122]Q6CG02.1 RecName: Full=Mediator of RNA polymerase II transcription subunit 8; AltName: Full=Mediator complex subunit 8 [Yarrowia lipolytica CLIB122]AOW01103.1 hypothetical protein YALI1_B03043g [Yarrowia lipolytica]KAB8281066.1 mediator of RNA polymerase II transcription subunit 8 [Yarrowia lipolytica]KAE8172949.1 mediator of RNA polymerase II transcription subunit 8 [Yarrowia lipolytica]KAJ8052002.1 mediator of RNA polymerase II transcription subun|eukprot:XP_500410.1 YALI0B02068p [Yarrowia lipolytica CLIB122]